MSAEDARFVFTFNLVIFGVGAKDPLEFLHHGLVAGMTLERRV
jgi:hypothetical protein